MTTIEALENLLGQVTLFCEQHGEADFETAQAVAALARARTEHPEYFPTRPMVAQHSPSSEETAAAFNLGAGRPVVQATDAERRQFEAWMAGHNWQCAPWGGKHYTDVFTRTTWAAWRDRAELARAEQAEPAAEVREDKRSGKLFIATLGDAELEPGTKLYASPPAAPAKLEPLTDAELDALIEREWGRGFMPNQLMAHRAFARAVVATHNAKLGGAK